jgi:hypothetical protein
MRMFMKDRDKSSGDYNRLYDRILKMFKTEGLPINRNWNQTAFVWLELINQSISESRSV